MIQPRNNTDECQKTCELTPTQVLASHSDQTQIQRTLTATFPYTNQAITIADLLEYWLNICEIPPKYLFNVMSYFTEDELHKEKLQTMGSNTNDGKLEYFDYCVKTKRTVYEVLFDFHSVKLPLHYLLEAIGTQKAREYSISSSNLLHPRQVYLLTARTWHHLQQIGITMAKVEFFSKYQRKKIGICSGWLSDAQVGERVFCWLRKGTLPFPKDIETPVVCIGPGTIIVSLH